MESISQGTAVVTGATSGIGAAYAVELARRGWKLILTGRRATKLQDLARTLRERYGVEASVEIIELSDPGAVEALARRLEATPVDLLVNNAGFGHKALFQDSDYAPLEQMVAVHVSTPMRLTRAVLPGMVRRGRGGIIQVSSAAALLPHPGNTVYSATKAFLKTFAETLALDLAGTGVAVQALCPSFTGLGESEFHARVGVPQPFQKRTGLIHWWMPAGAVVRRSLAVLGKGPVVCLPALHVRVLGWLFSLLPEGAYRFWVTHVFGRGYRASLKQAG